MFNKIALAVVATAIVAGCSPKNFESDPVTVDTPQGPVVCQLYTRVSVTGIARSLIPMA